MLVVCWKKIFTLLGSLFIYMYPVLEMLFPFHSYCKVNKP
jgi:hypothetical protein